MRERSPRHHDTSAPTGRGSLLARIDAAPLAAVAASPSFVWLAVATVCVGAFMGQVDASIAQLVLPVLQREFDAPLSAVSWVSLAYLLALAAMLPAFGRLADMLGRKPLYIVGFGVFIAGSALCGFAPSLPWLVGFRVLQAVGAALLQANSVAIVVTVAGGERRGKAIGIQATAQALGLSAGPALGGLLIHALGWRWVFWLNVPFGLIGMAMGWMILPQSRRDHARSTTAGGRESFDWLGLLLLAPALTAFIALIDQGREWRPWSPPLLACSAAVALLLPAFVAWERTRRHPLIDLTLFRRRDFWAGNVAGLLSYAMLFGLFFLMPFVFTRGYHLAVLDAGFRLAVVPVALGIVSPLCGGLSDRLGARVLTGLGMLASGAAYSLLAVVMTGAPASLGLIMAALALFGLGQGAFTSPNNSAIMGAAPPEQAGAAGGILNVTRSFGTSLGVAAAAAVLSLHLGAPGHRVHLSQLPPDLLLRGARQVAAMLALFALAAGLLSVSRRSQASGPVTASPE